MSNNTNNYASSQLYSIANANTSSSIFVDVFENRNPTSNDVNYPIQKKWLNTVNGNYWELISYTTSGGTTTANWINITAGTAGQVITLTGNSGGSVGSLAGNINTVGDAASINIVGNPATHTLTTSVIAPLLTSFGGTGVVSPTSHTLPVAQGASAMHFLGPLTNGQLLIGSTGLDPVASTITSGTGITITNGAGSITVASSGTTNISYTSVNHAASPYTVLVTDNYLACQTSTGTITINLPNAPVTGKVYIIKDSNGVASTNFITATTVGGVVTIDGSTTFLIATNYAAMNLIFNGTSYEVF